MTNKVMDNLKRHCDSLEPYDAAELAQLAEFKQPTVEDLIDQLSNRSLTTEQSQKLKDVMKQGIESTRKTLELNVNRAQRDLNQASKALDEFNKANP